MKYLIPLVIAASAAAAFLAEASAPSPHATSPSVDIGPSPWLTDAWQDVTPEDDYDDAHAGLDLSATGTCTRSEEIVASEYGDEEYASGVHAGPGAAEPEPHRQLRAREVAAGEVPRSGASNGFTIAELFEQRAALAGRRVALRATVVRRMDGVLGKTFLHLQDGSGSPERADYDLTATTSEDLSLGETVEVEGELLIDQELGLGYAYTALLTDVRRIELN
jgi:hypothetical protein